MIGLEFIRDLGIVVFVAALAGWGCKRIGLSQVVGYLLAGLIVGPYTPPASLVTDTGRIQTLAQLGLVFLMFSIGMQLSLRRLKSLGLALLVATAIGAALVFTLSRGLALGLGLDGMQGLFLAGMLVSSSSAIVSKSLLEAGRMHSPSGQFAGAITVLEDVVAVVVLALLNSFLTLGGAGQPGLGATLGGMGSFVALLGVGGLLLVPWVLRRMERAGSDELRTLLVAGLLCLVAFGAQAAGYSLALGAFVLGVVVADTPQRPALERAVGGLRDMFSAVFFVAIGMMIDLHTFGAIWWQILLVAAFALVARSLSCAFGLVAAGQPARLALEGGLSLTPIGEFAFISAQVGVAAGVLPPEYQPLSVGVALLTALVAPWLTGRAAPMAEALVRLQPRLVGRLLDEYRSWLERVEAKRAGSVLWLLGRKRVLQIVVGLAFASGLMLFAPPLERTLSAMTGLDLLLPRLSQLVFWLALGFVLLAVCVAVWRNISALAMMVAEATTRDLPNAALLRPVAETGLKVGAGALLFFWLTAVSPFHTRHWWVALVVLALAVVVLALLWRRLIHWHSEMEVRLHETLAGGGGAGLAAQTPAGWDLGIDEMTLPENSAAAGRSIGELLLRTRFGCTVVGIDRQGVGLTNPPPETVLYPQDRVLLFGSREQIAAARRDLDAVAATAPGSALADLVINRVRVPAGSPQVGRALEESAPRRETGVQIAGILREGVRILNPVGAEQLCAGDELLVLGTPAQLREFRRWLAGER